jgi:hypothetical protein
MAGNQTVKYNLVFDADVSKAKTEVQKLFNQLNQMSTARMN